MESLKYLLFAASLKIVLLPATAISELRKFEMGTGRVIEGEIVDVKPGFVTLRVDGKESGVNIKDFSEADRRYFREWLRGNRGTYEWPGERGFHSDGTTEEALPDGMPTVLWRADVGQGHAAVICDVNAAYTTGIQGGQFTITALRMADGQERWKQSYPVMAEPQLAVASPAADAEAGLVYTMGPLGRIDGWRLSDGGNDWATELPVSYPDASFPASGMFGSPVTGNRLYVEVGGPSYSLVAFAKSNGAESWRIGKHRSIGVTPVLAEIGGRQLIVSRNEYGIVGRRIETGTMAWDQAWVGKGGGRASPVVVGSDRVFVTSEQECALFRIIGDRTEQVWSNTALCSTVSTPIYHGGFLYGFNGDVLTCINAESGEVAWSTDAIGGGNLIRAAGRLLVVTRRSGELVIADVDPAKYVERSRSKVFDGASQTIPVLAKGHIFCRSEGGAVTCLKMRTKE